MEDLFKPRQVGLIKIRPFCTVYSKLTPVQSCDNGVLDFQSVFKEYDFSSVNPSVKSSDFSLGNLIAVGAFGNLTYVTMTDYHDMNFVDSISNYLNDVQKTEVQNQGS